MGYDMSIEGLSVESQRTASNYRTQARKLYQQRNELGDDAVPERDTETWGFKEGTGSAQWWRLHREAGRLSDLASELEGYFRLNIWGMGRCRELMHHFGMLDIETNHSPWPNPEDYGLEDWPDDENWPEDSPEARFRAAQQAVISEGEGLIRIYKLGSNDGWLVNPTEIRNSLAKVPKDGDGVYVLPEGTPEWFAEWLDYLERAAEHEGFKVW